MSELSESDFKSIVEAAVKDDGRIVKAVTTGFFVGLTILSRRKKLRWHGSFEFDPKTGDATCWSDYPNSAMVRGFVADVRRRIDNREA